MKRKLKLEWYKDLGSNEQAKVERAKEVLSALPTLTLLKKLLETRLAALDDSHTKKEHYGLSSWPYMQADYVGAKRTLQEIIELVTTEAE